MKAFIIAYEPKRFTAVSGLKAFELEIKAYEVEEIESVVEHDDEVQSK